MPIFTRNEIYVPCAKDFNDPFDAQLKYTTAGTKDERIKFVAGMIQRCDPIKSIQFCETRARELVQNRSEQDFQNAVDGMVEEDAANHFGILSLTEKKDDLLMWAHYGDKHRGFCLEFRADESFFREVTKVTYVDTYPEINFLNRTNENIVRFHSTKGKQWEYEQEWRGFSIKHGKGLHKFQPDALTGIIFGLLMPNENQQKIREWVQLGKSKPLFYKAHKKPREFGLDIIPLG